MRGSAGVWLLLVALLGAAAACWLCLGPGGGDDYADDYDAVHASVADGPGGPMLAGHVRTGAAAEAQGAYVLRGTVKDAQGKPATGVRVTARRRGAEPGRAKFQPGRDARGLLGEDGGSELQRAFAELAHPAPPGAPEAVATSDEHGAFTLTLKQRGRFDVRAEPEPPRAGTSAAATASDRDHPPIELRVLGGSAIRGRVLDAEGRGIAAALRGSWSADGLGAWSEGPVATDPSSGAFSFPAVPDGKVSLELLLTGRARYTARTVATPTDEEIVIRVGAEVPLLTGRVVTRTGQPVSGALVVASVARARPLVPQTPPAAATFVRYYAVTSGDGTFAVLGALGGPLAQLEAEAAGYLNHSSTPPLAAWSGAALGQTPGGPVEIVLFQGGTVEGRITEQSSGKPLAEAQVQAIALALDARVSYVAPPAATTDAQGRYRIDGVPLGRSSLSVRHATHYLPSQARAMQGMDQMVFMEGNMFMPGSMGAQGVTVFIETEGQRVTRDLELAPGVEVRGRVLGPDGAGVAGAQIGGVGSQQIVWYGGMSQDSDVLATSDPEGSFRIAGVAPSKSMTLTARKAPLLGVRSEPFVVSADAPVMDVVLRMEKGGSIAGQVVDEHGSAVEGAHVQVWPENNDGMWQGNEVKSRADGSFRIEGTGAGTWHLTAWMDDGRNGSASVQGLAAGESREGVTLKLVASVKLSGVLVDEQGQPATGKELLLVSPQGGNAQSFTDADGAFSFSGIAKGTQQLFAGGWNGPRVLLGSFEAPAQDLRVAYKEPPHAVIEGLVLDAQGRSVPLCSVGIRAGAAAAPAPSAIPMPAMGVPMPMGWGGAQVVNGWFRQQVGGEPPYQVTVSAPQDVEGRPLNLRGASVTVTDPNAGPLTIRLEPGLEVAGRVVDGSGRGVTDVRVSVAGIATTTDAQGAFAVGGLAEGTHKLQVQPAPPFVRPPESNAAAGTRDLVIRLTSGLAIAGSLRRADGRPVTNGWVSVQWPAAPAVAAGSVGANPDAQGRFRVEGVPPEVLVTVQAQAWVPEGEPALAPRTVKDVRPGTEDMELVVGAGASVSGTVVDARGRPVRSGFVQVARVGPDGQQQSMNHVPVKDDGTFALGGLEPGPIELTLMPQDGGAPGSPLKTDAPAVGVRLLVPERTPIRGRLVGALGSAGTWQVWCWPQEEPNRRVRATLSGDGDFTLDGVSGKGPWMVAARSDGDDRYALAGPVEGGTEGLRLELRQGRSIEGTVQAQPGSPLSPSGVRVFVSGAGFDTRVLADAQGAFRVRGLPPGRYTLTARGPDRQMGEPLKDVADGATAIRLFLK